MAKTLVSLLLLFSFTAEANYVTPFPFPPLSSLESTLSYIFINGKRGRKNYVGLNVGHLQPDSYKGHNRFRYRLYKQQHAAPLIFLLTGLGASDTNRSARHIAQLHRDLGYHVVVIPSTFRADFAATAGSSPYPGMASVDAYDLYKKMILIKKQLNKRKVPITDWAVAGFSWGALITGFIAQLDDHNKRFGFQKYLMLNPPIDLLHGLTTLDGFYAEYKKKSFIKKFFLLLEMNNFFTPTLLLGFDPWRHKYRLDKARLGERDQMALIGFSFRSTLTEVLYHSQEAADLGILGGKERFRKSRARRYGYEQYVRGFLGRYLTEHPEGRKLWKRFYGNRPYSVDYLNYRNSMTSLERTLRNNKKITVIHNEDDFLLRPQDIDFLSDTLGERFRLFSAGGHLGNLWHWKVRETIAEEWDLAF